MESPFRCRLTTTGYPSRRCPTPPSAASESPPAIDTVGGHLYIGTVRASGVVHSTGALGPGDHICWVYDDSASFGQAVVDFLSEGLRQGERVAFHTSASPEVARHLLRALGDLEELIRVGALEICALSDVYGDWATHPEARADVYAEATRAAVEAGYRGLRLATDVTPLVPDARHRSVRADQEALVDRYVAAHRFTVMCGYDRTSVGAGLTEVACLHPVTNLEGIAFQLSAGDRGGLVLAGEVDTFITDAFAVALGHATAGRVARLDIDGRELRFINHRGLLTLDTAAETVELVTRFSVAAIVAELLHLHHLDVHVER